MTHIDNINDELRQQVKRNNPVLAQRIATFKFIKIILCLIMWETNATILAFNLLIVGMGWPLAIVIFCGIWLLIWSIANGMIPMGRRLAAQQHEELLKAISEICDRAEQKT